MQFQKKIAKREVSCIIQEDGQSRPAYLTENLWQGFAPFANVSYGNNVTPLTSGQQYFETLITAIEAATEYIYIIGWQVSWDAQLKPNVRLFDVLFKVAQKKTVKIYIMPWDDTDPLQTYDDQSKAILLAINKMVGKEVVYYLLAPATPDQNDSFYSHHQKNIVIDGKIGFIGGLDVSYGRYDNANFDLHADAASRQALNRYNPCIPWLATLSADNLVNPDENGWFGYSDKKIKKIQAGAYQLPYLTTFLTHAEFKHTLDPSRQPRMPWQDVHCKIEGNAVHDMARNFVLRWRCYNRHMQLPPLPVISKAEGGVLIQVLRSASFNMCKQEYLTSTPVFMRRSEQAPTQKQDNIYKAMLTLIDKAQHFIYIEQQFFVSEFGEPSITRNQELSGPANKAKEDLGSIPINVTRIMPQDADALPKNTICNALINRIDKAINTCHAKEPFHVYITLPVHPEGPLNDASVMNQIHYTMQSLVFGSFSLLNGIRRSLKWKELHDAKDANPDRVWESSSQEHESIPMSACDQYVTLLNLRNWDKLDYTNPNNKQIETRYVTEQIYIHSKLMIVDDRFALLGSANINDRSLLGSRDSEIAALIMDSHVEKTDLCGDGKQRPVRKFARELRMQVWQKIFGITAGSNKAATELKEAILKPASPKSWKAIQKRAKENTRLYEAAFDWIPRNKDSRDDNPDPLRRKPASIWPRWHYSEVGNSKRLYSTNNPPMPFEESFWDAPQHTEAAKNLAHVKGFITAFPIEWTMGENNNIGLHSGLLTKRSNTPAEAQSDAQMADNNTQPETKA